MGKNKKDDHPIYPKSLLREASDAADIYESYLDGLHFLILTGRSVEEVNRAKKTVKKLIKHLRKGELDKVCDPDYLDRLIEESEDMEC